MTPNRATIFSNGIADFRRTYRVSREEPAVISLPVRKDHVADVLASLNLYGPVVLKSPPSFRPANESEGALRIDPGRVIEDLAGNLSGAAVSIERAGGTVAGTLVGLHSEPEGTGGDRIDPRFLVLLTGDGLTKIPMREVAHLRFHEEDLQKEITKALERNVQQIKPHSTFVTLSVETEQDEAEAILQYTIPAAAWKISYRLRRRPDDEGFEFQGFAIVDNNTDEDWTDFVISVVTGEPITFSTDLADSKIPSREHVNVVKDRALGSVEVEEAGMMMAAGALPAERMTKMRKSRGRRYMAHADMEAAEMAHALPAVTEDANAETIGDFCVFESRTPVSIAAQRSAVIPVFQTMLDETKSHLHFKHENHAERPYRAILFRNETEYSLGRGICTVYESGVYAGSCVLPATPPGEETLLPHALETGVRVRRKLDNLVSRVVGLRLSKGFGYTSVYQQQTTHYQLKNTRDESFEMFLDHDLALTKPNVSCTVTGEDRHQATLDMKEELKAGARYVVTIPPRERLNIRISESRVHESRARLITAKAQEAKIEWLFDNIVHTNGPLAQEPGVQRCLEIQQRLDDKREEIARAEAECERLAERQQRLRKNIGTGGHSEQTDRWRSDLGSAEDRITELEDETLPKLRAEADEIHSELRDALKSLSAEWRDEDAE